MSTSAERDLNLKPKSFRSSLTAAADPSVFETLPRSILRIALALVAVLGAAGFGLLVGAPSSRAPAIAALVASGIVLVASLTIGVHLYLRAGAAHRKATQLVAQAGEEAQRSAQTMAGMVSHELRSPLQTMLANLELLALEPQSPSVSQLAKGLEQCLVQIERRLDNIAQYTRLAGGQVELQVEPFLLVPFLDRVVAGHAKAAHANGQTLRLDAKDAVDLHVHGDEIRLQQVLDNFLSNAIRYSGAGAIEVRASVTRHTFETLGLAEAVEVGVSDHGPGVPEAERQSVWEPFVRGAARPNRPKGSGLGLSIVKLLATTAGWDVGMRCDAAGTTFFVVFPLSSPVAAPSP